jgi:hypothetical protein
MEQNENVEKSQEPITLRIFPPVEECSEDYKVLHQPHTQTSFQQIICGRKLNQCLRERSRLSR